MGHADDSRSMPPAVHASSPVNSSSAKRRNYQHAHVRRSHKRKKIKSLEPETSMGFQTLKPDFTSSFTSCTHRHATKYFGTEQRNRRKSRRVNCQRKWTYSPHNESNCNDRVVIMSYNILGVENATKHPELYRGVLPKYLDWGYRKKLIGEEIKSCQPSILCCQEVDRFDDVNEILGKDGFRGLHKARGGEACDGCAVFWKDDLFTLLHEENVEFQRFGLRNNVAQFCVLKMNESLPQVEAASSPRGSTARSLVVGNIHVLYNPKRGDVKLGQIRIFLEKAYELSQKWGNIPVVLTGDLNSLPKSAMYEFVASSKLHVQQHDRRHISGQLFPSAFSGYLSHHNPFARWNAEEIMLATGSRSGSLRHCLKLSSAYAGVPGSSRVRDQIGEPLATSYHCLFAGTVDYIWHTLDLVPVRVLETLSMNSLKKIGGLPSKEWGSDHLALVCELAFVDETD